MLPPWDTEDTIEQETGTAERTDASDDEHPVAVLWLIDPEARRGWREHYVRRQPKPKGRKMGYRT